MRIAATSVGDAFQVLAQQRLGLGDAVLAQRRRGGQQARVARGVADVAGVGGIGAAPSPVAIS